MNKRASTLRDRLRKLREMQVRINDAHRARVKEHDLRMTELFKREHRLIQKINELEGKA